MGSFSIWHWLIVLLVVVLVFGTKKLRNIGSDLGGADAVLAASIFHYGEFTVREAKQHMAQRGIEVRL